MLTNGQMTILWIFTVLSLLLVISPFVYYPLEGWYQQRVYGEKKAKPFGRKLLVYSFCIIASLISLHMAAGFVSLYKGLSGAPAATLDNLYHSILSAIQTFNAETTELNVGTLAEALVSGCHSFARGLLLFSYVLRLAAPVAGGAIFLEVLTEMFPSFKQEISFLRRHYYFSELNERSLALASSWMKEVTESDKEELRSLISLDEKGKKRRKGMTFTQWLSSLSRALVYRFCTPLAVFTDAYHDNESEKSAELYLKAKSLGAICLRRDISDVRPRRLVFKRHFFLIDDNEIDNIKTLATLTDERHMSILKRAEVYIFYQNDSYVLTERNTVESLIEKYREKYRSKYEKAYRRLCREQARNDISDAIAFLEADLEKRGVKSEITQEAIEQTVNAKWEEKAKKELSSKGLDGTDKELVCKTAHELRYRKLSMEAIDTLLPQVSRIRCYQNLIFRLLEDIPLYIPLTNKKREGGELKEYNITVLGNGETGSQMLRAASWCGQLYGYIPCINLFSAEPAETVRDQINSKCPELLESAREKSDSLRIFSDENINEYSPVYCRIRCANGDIERIPLSKVVFTDFNDENRLHSITDSDYYLVALGSDELNMQIAEQLGTMLRARQAQGERKNDKIVIVLAIYDTNLRKMFNLKNGERNSFIRSSQGGVLIEAFGSLDEAYSRRNITMQQHLPMSAGFDKLHRREAERQGKERMRQRFSRTYESWSGIARSVHRKYRMFSAFVYMQDKGMWQERPAERWSDFTDMDEDYFNTVYVSSKERSEQFASDNKSVGGADKPSVQERLKVEKCLGWLEHRRWNAYLRSEGFTNRTDGGAKDIELKLHPCLVECKMEPAEDYYKEEKEDLAVKKDRLDEVADKHYKGKVKSYDMPYDADKDFIAQHLNSMTSHQELIRSAELFPALERRYAAELEAFREEKENEGQKGEKE